MNVIRKILAAFVALFGAFIMLVALMDGITPGLIIASFCIFFLAYLIGWGRKPSKKAPSSIPEPDSPVSSASNNVIQAKSSPVVASDDIIKYSFSTAGISYRERDITDHLLVENPDYDMSKRELVEADLIEYKVFKYEDIISDVQLVPDPENEHDSNAIKVVANGIHVGFVPAKNISRVRNILEHKNPDISWDFYGGPYKILYEEYDDENDKEVYTLEKDRYNYGLKVTLSYHKE